MRWVESPRSPRDSRGIQSKRMSTYVWRKGPSGHERAAPLGEHQEPTVTAMGPIGFVYLNRPADEQKRERLAAALVAEDRKMVRAWTRRGPFTLPQQADQILTPNHPFFTEVKQDLIMLCHHPSAGDFVISGWNRMGRCYSFPVESGSHGSPGLEETHAFALLPQDIWLPRNPAGPLRPLALRQAALYHLGRDIHVRRASPVARRAPHPEATGAVPTRVDVGDDHLARGVRPPAIIRRTQNLVFVVGPQTRRITFSIPVAFIELTMNGSTSRRPRRPGRHHGGHACRVRPRRLHLRPAAQGT